MRSKEEVKQLIRDTSLTGWQAGLLVFEDSWLVTKEPGAGFLSDRQIETLKAMVENQGKAKDYQAVIRLYRIADFIERQARVELLTACALLERHAAIHYLYSQRSKTREASQEELKRLSDVHLYSHDAASLAIRKMQARRQVLHELGLRLGLDLEEEVNLIIEAMLVPAIGRHNDIWKAARPDLAPLSECLKGLWIMSPLSLKGLPPPARELAEVRGYVDEVLGDSWWTRQPASDKPPKSILPPSVKEHWMTLEELR